MFDTYEIKKYARNFNIYCDEVKNLGYYADQLEALCAEMTTMEKPDEINTLFEEKFTELLHRVNVCVENLKNNEQRSLFRSGYSYPPEYKSQFKAPRKEYKKSLKRCLKYTKICQKIMSTASQGKCLGQSLSNKRLKLIVQKLQAEATIKDAENKKNEAVIAVENANKAQAEALAAAENAKKAKIEARSREAEVQALLEDNKKQRKHEKELAKIAQEAISVAKAASKAALEAGDLQEAKRLAEEITNRSRELAKLAATEMPDSTEMSQQKTHQEYKNILKDIKCGIAPMLVGPAGGGKSTILQQAAQTLNLPYYPMSVNGQTSEYSIVGYKNANGEYIRTAFREAFENGGLFSFEEIDAGNPNVLTVINNALSQDYYLFPDTLVKKSQNFILAASANTYGRGANMQYIGRNPLDAATLDRFAMTYIDYDEELEKQIGPVPEWTDYIQNIRHVVAHFGMPIVVSMRAIIFGGRLIQAGQDREVVLSKFVWRGCKKEDVEKIKKQIVNNREIVVR